MGKIAVGEERDCLDRSLYLAVAIGSPTGDDQWSSKRLAKVSIENRVPVGKRALLV